MMIEEWRARNLREADQPIVNAAQEAQEQIAQHQQEEEMEVQEQGPGLEGEEWEEWIRDLEDMEDRVQPRMEREWVNLRPEQIVSLMMVQHAMLVPVRYHLVESLQEVFRAEEDSLLRVVNVAGNHWIGQAAAAEIQKLRERRQRLEGAIDGLED
uniref:Non-structural protein 4 n=1 Tax=African horse sickness virus TaxID=40050 RepID=A0A6B9HDN2_AHSV|nr:non-structural protein 4 [African horse sickness virus]